MYNNAFYRRLLVQGHICHSLFLYSIQQFRMNVKILMSVHSMAIIHVSAETQSTTKSYWNTNTNTLAAFLNTMYQGKIWFWFHSLLVKQQNLVRARVGNTYSSWIISTQQHRPWKYKHCHLVAISYAHDVIMQMNRWLLRSTVYSSQISHMLNLEDRSSNNS